MATKKSFNKIIAKQCKEKTSKIVVGNVYFLSSFHDEEGCYVRVLSKSNKENLCGWPSSVEVQVIEGVNLRKDTEQFYAVGTKHTVNASNLYTRKEDASHRAKFPSFYKQETNV